MAQPAGATIDHERGLGLNADRYAVGIGRASRRDAARPENFTGRVAVLKTMG